MLLNTNLEGIICRANLSEKQNYSSGTCDNIFRWIAESIMVEDKVVVLVVKKRCQDPLFGEIP